MSVIINNISFSIKYYRRCDRRGRRKRRRMAVDKTDGGGRSAKPPKRKTIWRYFCWIFSFKVNRLYNGTRTLIVYIKREKYHTKADSGDIRFEYILQLHKQSRVFWHVFGPLPPGKFSQTRHVRVVCVCEEWSGNARRFLMWFCARARETIGRPTAERPVPNAIFIKWKKKNSMSPSARTVCRVLLVAVASARSFLPGKLHVVSVTATGYQVSVQCFPRTGSTVPWTNTRSRPAAHHHRRRATVKWVSSTTQHTHRQGRISKHFSTQENP